MSYKNNYIVQCSHSFLVILILVRSCSMQNNGKWGSLAAFRELLDSRHKSCISCRQRKKKVVFISYLVLAIVLWALITPKLQRNCSHEPWLYSDVPHSTETPHPDCPSKLSSIIMHGRHFPSRWEALYSSVTVPVWHLDCNHRCKTELVWGEFLKSLLRKTPWLD